MNDATRARRAGAVEIAGRRRAISLAERLGRSVRQARSAARMKQGDLGTMVRLSQPEVSRLERGHGGNAGLDTWAILAAALGQQLAAFLERVPGTSLPRDYEHLKRQQLIVETARAGV